MKEYSAYLERPFVPSMLERFLRYVRIGTQSDRHVDTIPSTPQQWELGRALVVELKKMGVAEVSIDDHCYVIARIPASPSCENKPSIGLMAHMDTAHDAPGDNVQPRVVKNYDGRKLALSETWSLDPAEFPDLADHSGDTIIVTDGSTLLGADDKAGLAEIITAVEWLLSHPEIQHGPIELFFTPDEETGKGMDLFPRAQVQSVACYTMDGGKAGEIEAECFTAYGVHASFKGKSIHTGSARGKLANAVVMASSFVGMLPRSESPEATDGWYGFYAPLEIKGSIEQAHVDLLLRDFADEGIQARIAAVHAFAAAVEAQFPLGSVTLEIKKQYSNMRAKLDENPHVLSTLEEAVRRAGLEPVSKPIRGGTDGSRLTEMGIPTPNIFTGGYNYHSRNEWASVAEMALAVDTLLHLLQLWAA